MTKHSTASLFLLLQKELLQQNVNWDTLPDSKRYFDHDVRQKLSYYRVNDPELRAQRQDFRSSVSKNTKARKGRQEKSKTTGMLIKYDEIDPRKSFEKFMELLLQSTSIEAKDKIEIILTVGTVLSKGDSQTVRYMDSYNRTMIQTIQLTLQEIRQDGVTFEESQQIDRLESQLAALKGNKTIDRSNVTDAFVVAGAVVLFPFVLAYQAFDKPKKKSKKEQAKEREDAINKASAEAKEDLSELGEKIKKERDQENQRKLNELNRPKPIVELPALNPEKKITLELAEIVKQLLGYKTDEIPASEEAFAKAVNTIVTSNDPQEQQKNFWIMLDPVHAGTLQRFLTNLAASNIDSKGIGDNLQGKIKTFTGPLVEAKLEAANGGQPSYRDSEVKMIQLDLALHIAQWNKTHPGSDPKGIPTPYRRGKGDTLGYPDIFKTISGKEVADKDKVKILDITRYIYAMEEQEIFDEESTDGKKIMPQDIFYYLSVLPERDQQRDVVIALAHKHRTIKKLQVTLKDKVEPKKINDPENIEVPTYFNYRQYLFQLINEQLLPPSPKDKKEQSLNDPNTQEQPESDEVIIRKYLYYLINLWENVEFQAKLKKLQSSVTALQKVSSSTAGEVEAKAKAAEQAYQELTELLKKNNGTRHRLHQVLGAPAAFGAFIVPTRIPFNSDDPREKVLFDKYKAIYGQMSALERQLHQTNIQLAQKKRELYGMSHHGNASWFDKTIYPQYQLSFADRVSSIPGTIENLNETINSNYFDIKNERGTPLRQIRTVDVYNQVSNKEEFTPLRHISVPTMSDANEIFAVFDNNRGKVGTYLAMLDKQPSLATRTVNMRYGEGEHTITTESPDSDSYHQKQLQALCGLLHKITIPGYGTYIVENISDQTFQYLLNREKVFEGEEKTLARVRGLKNGKNTNAKFIFLPQRTGYGPYSICDQKSGIPTNVYFATIDDRQTIGLTDLPPHGYAFSNSSDPFLYKRYKDRIEAGVTIPGYGEAAQAQEQRQLILDNDPYLQRAESIFLGAKEKIEPLMRMLELYNAGKKGDESLSIALKAQVQETGSFFAGKEKESTETRRDELKTAAAHIRMYIGKYKVNPYNPMVGPYEATILKFQAIEKELSILDGQGPELFSNRTTTRDAEAMYTFLKTLLVIAGTISVTILTGGTGLPFLATAAISVAGGMVVGRVVDEGRYYYMNHVTPVSFQASDGKTIAMDYTRRSDLMDAAHGRRSWGEVLGQMGPEFGMGMFWYMLGSGLIKIGNGGLARFQKGLQQRIGSSDGALKQTYQSIDNWISKKLSQHIDILESPGMRSFFKQFGNEFGEELTEEGLGDVGQKLGGEYGGPIGAVIEAAIGIRAGNRYRAGQVDIWPSFNRRTATGTESTVYFRNPVVADGGTTNRQLIINQLNTIQEDGSRIRTISENSDGSFTANGSQTGSDGVTYTNSIHFVATDAPAGMLNIQHDPELSAYRIIEQANTEEEGRTVRNYQATVYNDGNGPNQADRANLLRYQNMIVIEESENTIIAHDAEGNIVHIQLVPNNIESANDGNPNTVEMGHYEIFNNPREAFGISPFNTCIGIIVVEPTTTGNRYHVAHIGHETDPNKIDTIIGGMSSIENKAECQVYVMGGRNMADDRITLSQTQQFRSAIQGRLSGYGLPIHNSNIYWNESGGNVAQGTWVVTIDPNTGDVVIRNANDPSLEIKQWNISEKPPVDIKALEAYLAKLTPPITKETINDPSLDPVTKKQMISSILSLSDATHLEHRLLVGCRVLGIDMNDTNQWTTALRNLIIKAHRTQTNFGKAKILLLEGVNKGLITREQARRLMERGVCGHEKVDMDDFQVFNRADGGLKSTKGLGPCVGVCIYNPVTQKTHILHDSTGWLYQDFIDSVPEENRASCRAFLTGANPYVKPGTMNSRDAADYTDITISQRVEIVNMLVTQGFDPNHIIERRSEGKDNIGGSIVINQDTGDVTLVTNGDTRDTHIFNVDAPIEYMVNDAVLTGRIDDINAGKVEAIAEGTDSFVYKLEYKGKSYALKKYKQHLNKQQIDDYYRAQNDFATYVETNNLQTSDGKPVRLVSSPIISREQEDGVRVVVPFIEGGDLDNNDPRVQEIQTALEQYMHNKNPDSQVNPRHVQALNIRVTDEGLVVTDIGGNTEYFLYDAMSSTLIPMSESYQVAQLVGFDTNKHYSVFYQDQARRPGNIDEMFDPIINNIASLNNANRKNIAQYLLSGLRTEDERAFDMKMEIPGGIIVDGISYTKLGHALLAISEVTQTAERSMDENDIREYKEQLLTQLFELYLPGRGRQRQVRDMKDILMKWGVMETITIPTPTGEPVFYQAMVDQYALNPETRASWFDYKQPDGEKKRKTLEGGIKSANAYTVGARREPPVTKEQVDTFFDMKKKILESKRYVRFEEFTTALRSNAAKLKDQLSDKKRVAVIDDWKERVPRSEQSNSRMRVTDLFCQELGQISGKGERPNHYLDTGGLKAKMESGELDAMDAIVISDDIGYSGSQIAATVTYIQALYQGTGKTPPKIIINTGFMSLQAQQRIIQAFGTNTNFEIMPPISATDTGDRRIYTIYEILQQSYPDADPGMLINNYNNTLDRLMASQTPNEALMHDQTTTYTERRIPNSVSLANVVRNGIIGDPKPYGNPDYIRRTRDRRNR